MFGQKIPVVSGVCHVEINDRVCRTLDWRAVTWVSDSFGSRMTDSKELGSTPGYDMIVAGDSGTDSGSTSVGEVTVTVDGLILGSRLNCEMLR